MPPVYREQRFSGTPMTEVECFTRAIDHLQSASNCFRGLAQLRGDMRWLLPVRIMDQMVDKIKVMMVKPGKSLLWLPERDRR